MTRIQNLVALALVSLTGCYDIGGDFGFGASACLGDFIEIGENAGMGFDICVEIGDGMIGDPIQEDGITIEIINLYGEQAQQDASYAIVEMSVSCLVEDDDNNPVPAHPYVYTDGLVAYVYIPNVPSHFEAECTGSVQLGGGGPGYYMFGEGNQVTEVTMIMHEDEVVDDWRERNGSLDIDYD